MLARNQVLVVVVPLALALAACGDARPAIGGGGGGGGGCTICHGTAGRTGALGGTDANLAAAPPVAPANQPAQVVGVHQAHVNPSANPLRGPIACSECHVVPTDATHASSPPASPVQFPAGSLARSGGAQPTWDSPDKATSTTCSNVYCHGNFTWSSVVGNTANKPDWTAVGQPACGSCHGLPPTGHISLGPSPTAATCNGCHPGTVDPTGQIIVNAATGASLHINGQVDVSIGSCTVCHGTAGRTGTLGGTDPNLAAAPPVQPPGEPTQVVGAHQAHLNPAAGSLAGPIACSECHVVPTDSAHATSPPAQIVRFGTLATTGGALPTWNSPNKVTTPTCSSVYCHGNFTFGGVSGTAANTPDWTLAGQAACGSCHGLPPAGHIANASIVANDPRTCSGCHPGTVAADGSIIVNAATGASLHVNGKADEGAHADPSWLTASGGNHTSAALNQTPPFATCLTCHVAFGAADPTNVAGSSCNACHQSALAGAATTAWQQNCVFCHGDKSKLLTYAVADQTSDPWIIAPPTGALGQTLATDLAVGAHQKHVNPSVNTLSNAFLCSECHTATLPPDLSQPGHLSADGSVPVLLQGSIATAGGVRGTFTSPSCSATYCHGNFIGGNNAAPAWNGDSTNSTCTSCHGVTGNSFGISPRTGRHPTNWSLHAFMGNNCQYCHNTVATGSTTGTPSITASGKALHVNGTRNVSFSGGGTWTPFTTGYGGTCAPSCHGSQTW